MANEDLKYVRRYSRALGTHVLSLEYGPAMKSHSRTAPAPAPRVASKPTTDNSAPPRPDFAAALRASRSTVPTQRVLADYEARVVAARKGVNVNGVPNPPRCCWRRSVPAGCWSGGPRRDRWTWRIPRCGWQ
jgi:hypothetical protein